MNTPINSTPTRPGQHPLMIAAAIAVILFCLLGTAAIMGWIPNSISGNAANRELSEADRQALSSQMAPPPAPRHEEAARRAAPAARDAEPAPRKATKTATATPAKSWCSNCGNVESVREITTRAEGSGLGAAGGAVLGGLLGSQVGDGSGKKLATVAGAVGGAVVGNQVEGNMKATKSYEIKVRLDDGSARTFKQSSSSWRTGQRVKIVDGALRPVG
jgi:outer membrane lipoprotein SlyB